MHCRLHLGVDLDIGCLAVYLPVPDVISVALQLLAGWVEGRHSQQSYLGITIKKVEKHYIQR